MTNRLPAYVTVIAIAFVSSSIAAQNVAQRTPKQSSSYVTTTSTPGGFALASGGRAAPIYVSGKDFAGVVRVANDLRADVERVTGTAPRVVADSSPSGQQVVIVGTLGKSPIIDRLVREKKLDAAAIARKVGSVRRADRRQADAGRRPRAGHRRQRQARHDLRRLRPVGADRRLALVLVGRRAGARISASCSSRPARTRNGEPAVKYRGIFINDEAPAFTGWAREKFGGVNHQRLREGLRADPAAEGQLPLARDVGQRVHRRRSAEPAARRRIRHRRWARRTTSR